MAASPGTAGEQNPSSGFSYTVRELPDILLMARDDRERVLAGLVSEELRAGGKPSAGGEPEVSVAFRLAEEQREGRTHLLAERPRTPSVFLTVRYEPSGVVVERIRSLPADGVSGDGMSGDGGSGDYRQLFDELLEGIWESAPAVFVECLPGSPGQAEGQPLKGQAQGPAWQGWAEACFGPRFTVAGLRLMCERADHSGADRACGAVVFRETEGMLKYLLIRQHDGAWGFPKGHMDPGESERQTARREIAEETGVSVAIEAGFRELVTYVLPSGRRKWVTYFLAMPERNRSDRTQEVAVQAEEIADFAWLSFGEASRRLSYPNTREVLEKAGRFLHLRNALL